MMLLFERPRSALVTLAAAITIAALLFDPFVQQIVRYPTRTIITSSGTASTKRASGFPIDPSSIELIRTLNSGLWSQSGQLERKPLCSSGDCEWPTFSSLGWCSKCEDVKSSVIVSYECIPKGNRSWSEGSCTLSLGSGTSATYARVGNHTTKPLQVAGYQGDTEVFEWVDLSDRIVWATSQMTSEYLLPYMYPTYGFQSALKFHCCWYTRSGSNICTCVVVLSFERDIPQPLRVESDCFGSRTLCSDTMYERIQTTYLERRNTIRSQIDQLWSNGIPDTGLGNTVGQLASHMLAAN